MRLLGVPLLGAGMLVAIVACSASPTPPPPKAKVSLFGSWSTPAEAQLAQVCPNVVVTDSAVRCGSPAGGAVYLRLGLGERKRIESISLGAGAPGGNLDGVVSQFERVLAPLLPQQILPPLRGTLADLRSATPPGGAYIQVPWLDGGAGDIFYTRTRRDDRRILQSPDAGEELGEERYVIVTWSL